RPREPQLRQRRERHLDQEQEPGRAAQLLPVLALAQAHGLQRPGRDLSPRQGRLRALDRDPERPRHLRRSHVRHRLAVQGEMRASRPGALLAQRFQRRHLRLQPQRVLLDHPLRHDLEPESTPMTRFALSTLRLSVAAALCGLPASLLAASGEFTFVTGDVSLQKANGQRSAPARGTPVDAGDRIVTGPNGMAQLNMVDQARLSLRPNTQFLIEAYPDKRDSNEGAVLSLLRGTLRTFTGLIASGSRDRYVMKTRVATVGIRGSGNILYACDPGQCDPSVADAKNDEPITVNHTIEGSHSVSNLGNTSLPPQQGGVQTLITGPGQTVLVAGNQPPRYIPTPSFIADAATTMAGAKPASGSSVGSTETRNFSPSDTPALPASQQVTTQVVTTNP